MAYKTASVPMEGVEDVEKHFFGPSLFEFEDLDYDTAHSSTSLSAYSVTPERTNIFEDNSSTMSEGSSTDAAIAAATALPGPLPQMIVDTMDNFPYKQDNPAAYNEIMQHFYRVFVKGFAEPIGYIHASMIVELPVSKVKDKRWPDYWVYDATDNTLVFSGGDTFDSRTRLLNETVLAAQSKSTRQASAAEIMPLDRFRHLSRSDVPVFESGAGAIMDINKAAVPAFGLPYYSVSVVPWTRVEGHRYYWIPKLTETFAKEHDLSHEYEIMNHGCFSNHTGSMPLAATLVAGQTQLSPELIQSSLRFIGSVKYINLQHDVPLIAACHPRIENLFELKLDANTQLGYSPAFQSLHMYRAHEVWKMLAEGKFQKHAQMPLLALFIKHGYLNADNEPNLGRIKERITRTIEFSGL